MACVGDEKSTKKKKKTLYKEFNVSVGDALRMVLSLIYTTERAHRSRSDGTGVSGLEKLLYERSLKHER